MHSNGALLYMETMLTYMERRSALETVGEKKVRAQFPPEIGFVAFFMKFEHGAHAILFAYFCFSSSSGERVQGQS